MSLQSNSPLVEAQVDELMHSMMREVLQTSQTLVEKRLEELGLISPGSSAPPLTYPVMVSQNDRPVGVTENINFMGSGVQTSWDQSAGGQVTVLIAGEDVFTLLMFTGSAGVVLPTTSLLAWTKVAFPCELINWELTTDASTPGSVVVDIQTCTYSTYPTFASITGSVSGTGGTPPNIGGVPPNPIVSGIQNRSDDLSLWSRSLDRGTYLGFMPYSVSGVQRILLALTLQRLVQGYQGG